MDDVREKPPELEGYKTVGVSNLLQDSSVKHAYSTLYPENRIRVDSFETPTTRWAVYVLI